MIEKASASHEYRGTDGFSRAVRMLSKDVHTVTLDRLELLLERPAASRPMPVTAAPAGPRSCARAQAERQRRRAGRADADRQAR